MDIKVVEEIQGSISEAMYTIISHGTSCDFDFDRFAIGDEIITSILATSEPDGLTNFPFYSFGACSTSYLKLDGNTVTGNIAEGVSSTDYEEFKRTIGQCADIDFLDRTQEFLEKYIYIYPNPTSGFVRIHSDLLPPKELSGELYNTSGQLILSLDHQAYFDDSQIDLSNLANGIYYLRIKAKEHSTTKVILKRE